MEGEARAIFWPHVLCARAADDGHHPPRRGRKKVARSGAAAAAAAASSKSIAARVKARKRPIASGARSGSAPPPPEAEPSQSFLAALGLDFGGGDARRPPPPPPPGIAPYVSHGFRLALEKAPARKAASVSSSDTASASDSNATPLLRECAQRTDFEATGCFGALDIPRYRVTDYAPAAFHFIRTRSGITRKKHLLSLSRLTGGGKGAGKSGQLFFQSHDGAYVLKTIKPSELPVLLEILPSYAAFLARHPCSLLPRFFGLASFTLPKKHGGAVVLVIMENVLRPKPLGKSGWFTRRPARRQRIHEVYDLKGSTKGRVTVFDPANFDSRSASSSGGGGDGGGSSQQAHPNNKTKSNAGAVKHTKKSGPLILKDLNCQRRLRLSPLRRGRFFRQLRADVKFLISWNLMDYSLLMGVSFNGGSGAYRKASVESRTGRAASVVTARSRISGDMGGAIASSSVTRTADNLNSSINGDVASATTAAAAASSRRKSALLSAVVNRVYTADRSADFLPPGSAYTLSFKTVGRSCVRERGKAPYIGYHMEVTRVPQSGRHRKTTSWIIYRRYSDFRRLRRQLNLELASAGYTVPALPAKVWLGNFDGAVLDKRQRALDLWMAQILGAFVRVVGNESTATLRTLTSGAGSLASLALRRFLTDDANEPPLGMRISGDEAVHRSTSNISVDESRTAATARQKKKSEIMRVSRATDMESGERVTLYLGVIDILQAFTMTKQIESSVKGALSHPDAISSTSAQKYGERFIKYLSFVLLES